jgi:hypothetical protein
MMGNFTKGLVAMKVEFTLKREDKNTLEDLFKYIRPLVSPDKLGILDEVSKPVTQVDLAANLQRCIK